jgi:replication factor A1
MSFEKILKLIIDGRPEITRERILARLAATRDMTGGLIADVSLLRMIAAELDVDVPNEKGEFKQKFSLAHLVTGLNNVTVTGRVVAIFPVKSFDGNRTGKLASLSIVDQEGIIRVVLWNEKADVIESSELKIGQIVKFSHGYTKADRSGNPELHLSERGQIDLKPQNVDESDYPFIEKFSTKIGNVNSEQKSINLKGEIKETYGTSTFIRSDQTDGRVLRAKIGDETGEIIAVFWNEKVEEVETVIKKGVNIQIVNGRAKPNQNGELEVHVDNSTYLTLSEPPKFLFKIADLTKEFEEVNIVGEVASVPTCREVKTSKGELVKLTSFDLADETGKIRITAWREHSETACKMQVGERIAMDNIYAKIGYSGNVELSTRSSSIISRL